MKDLDLNNGSPTETYFDNMKAIMMDNYKNITDRDRKI